MKGIGKATERRTLSSKVHRLAGGAEPTAKRNRMTRSRTKCGTTLTWTWPFEVTEANACQLCYPDFRATDPVTAEALRLERELGAEPVESLLAGGTLVAMEFWGVTDTGDRMLLATQPINPTLLARGGTLSFNNIELRIE